jgi:hypothetical protein
MANKPTSQIVSEINTEIVIGVPGGITAPTVNGVLLDIAQSYQNVNDPYPGSTITGGTTPVASLPTSKFLYSDGSHVQGGTFGSGLSFAGGTLTASGGGGGAGVQTYTNLAALEAANVPNVPIVYVQGYTTPGTGGFYVRKVVSPPAHPLVYQSADGAWWEYYPEDGINITIEQVGGQGTLTTSFSGNEYTGFDNLTVLNNALAYTWYYANRAFFLGGGFHINFAALNYFFSNTIILSMGVTIKGSSSTGIIGGPTGTAFLFPNNCHGIHVTDNGAMNGRQPCIEQINLMCNAWQVPAIHGNPAGQYHGIWLTYTAFMDRIGITGFTCDGVHMVTSIGAPPPYGGGTNQTYYNLVNVNFVGRDGFHIGGSDVNATTLIHCSAQACGSWGFNDQSFLGCTHVGHHTSSCGYGNNYLTTYVRVGPTEIWRVTPDQDINPADSGSPQHIGTSTPPGTNPAVWIDVGSRNVNVTAFWAPFYGECISSGRRYTIKSGQNSNMWTTAPAPGGNTVWQDNGVWPPAAIVNQATVTTNAGSTLVDINYTGSNTFWNTATGALDGPFWNISAGNHIAISGASMVDNYDPNNSFQPIVNVVSSTHVQVVAPAPANNTVTGGGAFMLGIEQSQLMLTWQLNLNPYAGGGGYYFGTLSSGIGNYGEGGQPNSFKYGPTIGDVDAQSKNIGAPLTLHGTNTLYVPAQFTTETWTADGTTNDVQVSLNGDAQADLFMQFTSTNLGIYPFTMSLHGTPSKDIQLCDFNFSNSGPVIIGPSTTSGKVSGAMAMSDIYLGSRANRLTFAGSSAPASGTWAQGDRVFNQFPAVGQPKGWICTVAGTPGTWVSEGNL